MVNNQIKWKDFVQTINSPALISDSSHIILDYNKSFNDFSGLSGEDLVGKHCSNVFHRLNFEDTCEYHGSTVEDREVYDTHEMENYGKHALISCTPLYDENNDLEFTVHILTDITELKNSKKTLEESYFDKERANEVTMKLVGVTDIPEIYSIIGNAVKELIPDSYVIVSAMTSDWNHMKMVKFLGPEKYINIIKTFLGVDLYAMEFPMDVILEKEKEDYQSGLLNLLEEGIYDITMGTIPRPVCKMIERISHINEVYSIGFSWEGENYGALTIALTHGGSMAHKATIEKIVYQASIAIQRSIAEEKLKSSLVEKDVLLREVHHRVKNNMQIVSSLLNLQTHYVEREETVNVLKESQGRVKTMAMIHEKLYQSQNLSHINIKSYIENLVTDIFYSYGVKKGTIKPIVNIEDVEMSLETAIPCGLIINELVTNSIKYAFPDHREGVVKVTLTNNGSKYFLTVVDDGIGLPYNIGISNKDTLGLQLVNSLRNQLEGELDVYTDHGTAFNISFDDVEYKERV